MNKLESYEECKKEVKRYKECYKKVNIDETTLFYLRKVKLNIIHNRYVKKGSRWFLESTDSFEGTNYNLHCIITFTLAMKDRILRKNTKYGYLPYKFSSINCDKSKKSEYVIEYK